jgi:hypothetical protein
MLLDLTTFKKLSNLMVAISPNWQKAKEKPHNRALVLAFYIKNPYLVSPYFIRDIKNDRPPNTNNL